MSSLSTHVLDTARGGSAVGVPIVLKQHERGTWTSLASGTTNDDGRLPNCLPEDLPPGIYALTFEVETYFTARGIETFYPYAEIVFKLESADEHYHVPLLVSPFGYSTYRGS